MTMLEQPPTGSDTPQENLPPTRENDWGPRWRALRPVCEGRAARRIELSRVVSAVTGAEEKPRLGRFVVEAKIAEGAMGVVYRARDPLLDRDVALKVLKTDLGRDQVLNEAKALAQISHPAVVALYDIGTAHDEPYIAMEYVAGCTLRRWLGDHRGATVRDVVRLFLQAATGLAAVHRCGVVHRDFKPDNVLVATDGRVRLVDFGLARMEDQLRAGSEAPLEPVGTPRFMAPEQRRGQRVDARSDQYSFCLSLWRALEPDAEPGTHSSSIPLGLRSVLARGLREEPELRWPSMDELVVALTRTLQERPKDGTSSVTMKAPTPARARSRIDHSDRSLPVSVRRAVRFTSSIHGMASSRLANNRTGIRCFLTAKKTLLAARPQKVPPMRTAPCVSDSPVSSAYTLRASASWSTTPSTNTAMDPVCPCLIQ
jgi:serine/threonine protein kinase